MCCRLGQPFITGANAGQIPKKRGEEQTEIICVVSGCAATDYEAGRVTVVGVVSRKAQRKHLR